MDIIELIKYMIKQPLVSLLGIINLFILYPVIYIILKHISINSAKVESIMYFGFALSFIVTSVWLLSSFITTSTFMYKKDINNGIEYNEEIISWKSNIQISLLANTVISIIVFIVCMFNNSTFKTFIIWCLIIAISRLIIITPIDLYYKRKNIKSTI